MPCLICKRGETAPGETDVILDRDNAVVVIRGVPADICDECDEYYLAEDVALAVERLADGVISCGAEVSILRYAA